LKLKIFKKLRTASLNSELTGSYKKVYGTLDLKIENLQAHFVINGIIKSLYDTCY